MRKPVSCHSQFKGEFKELCMQTTGNYKKENLQIDAKSVCFQGLRQTLFIPICWTKITVLPPFPYIKKFKAKQVMDPGDSQP